jgi:prepilin-type N-terminal cleavage/methylation domain-containing protein
MNLHQVVKQYPSSSRTARRQLSLSFFNQRGLSLVELMVAMTIALIILSAISYVFFSARQGYNVQDSQSRIQENIRFAIDAMSTDIKMAGYFGCTAPKHLGRGRELRSGSASRSADAVQIELVASKPVMTNNTNWLVLSGQDDDATDRGINPSYVLRVIPSAAAATHPALPNIVRTGRHPGTDVLLILKAGADAQPVTDVVRAGASGDAIVGVKTPELVKGAQGQPLMVISDCYTAKIARPTIPSTLPGGVPPPGGLTYTVANGLNRNGSGEQDDLNFQSGGLIPGAGAIMTFEPVIYYVRAALSADEQPRLMRMGLSSAPANSGRWQTNNGGDVVADGVTQIQYTLSVIPPASTGITTNSPIQYTLAQMTSDALWYNVVGVNVALTAKGEKKTAVTTGDGRLAQQYTFSAGVRARQGTYEYQP